MPPGSASPKLAPRATNMRTGYDYYQSFSALAYVMVGRAPPVGTLQAGSLGKFQAFQTKFRKMHQNRISSAEILGYQEWSNYVAMHLAFDLQSQVGVYILDFHLRCERAHATSRTNLCCVKNTYYAAVVLQSCRSTETAPLSLQSVRLKALSMAAFSTSPPTSSTPPSSVWRGSRS